VVARIFGGKKLGIPGLIEAYRSAAAAVIAAAGTKQEVPGFLLEVTVPYDRLAALRHAASLHHAEELSAVYGPEVLLRFKVPEEAKTAFLGLLAGWDLVLSTEKEEN
ncbi:MAG: hypothetical protein GX493_11810, partial [Firmicutes bacterium]|nr:hypothetical protein [Bacillota bacterium]